MKLHVYEQDNSNITWVREDLWTEADMRVRKVGYADKRAIHHNSRGQKTVSGKK